VGFARMPQRLVARAPRIVAPPKKAHYWYRSPEWRALVARLKALRGPFCVRCGAGGRGVRIIGDHIRELKDGGALLDPMNVQLLCAPCHARKTAAAKAARAGLGTGA
jgi:5-methylcytosine-specific restriction enzyme A